MVRTPFFCTFTGNELIRERLQLICLEEKVSCSKDAMKCLVETSGGDLRRAITCLQSCSRLKGPGIEIHADDVQEVAGVSVCRSQ
jgi:replication factor C subunit 2/4